MRDRLFESDVTDEEPARSRAPRDPSRVGFLARVRAFFAGLGDAGVDGAYGTPGVLPEGMSFAGDLRGEGDIHILGAFEGDIDISGTVTVGPESSIVANISASAIVIAGKVTGDISASTQVDMLPTGTLTGSVRGASFRASEGASLRGQVWLDPPGKDRALKAG